MAREPALAAIAADLVVACFLLVTPVADAHLYCCALHRLTEEQGVVFHFGTSVTGFKRIGTGIAVVETDSENVRADAFAVAAGSYSTLNTGHGHFALVDVGRIR